MVSSSATIHAVKELSPKTKFVVWNLFQDDVVVEVLFNRSSRRKEGRGSWILQGYLKRTIVCSECHYCVLLIIRCAVGAHIKDGLATRSNTCTLVENLHNWLSLNGEDGVL
mmetsp:Transcript_73784/g.108311  ORF Transcript_73784/g.108311 Transcript_73784/m.108311 type:complete len:111 (+) Transcript_73784:248-580(+)